MSQNRSTLYKSKDGKTILYVEIGGAREKTDVFEWFVRYTTEIATGVFRKYQPSFSKLGLCGSSGGPIELSNTEYCRLLAGEVYMSLDTQFSRMRRQLDLPDDLTGHIRSLDAAYLATCFHNEAKRMLMCEGRNRENHLSLSHDETILCSSDTASAIIDRLSNRALIRQVQGLQKLDRTGWAMQIVGLRQLGYEWSQIAEELGIPEQKAKGIRKRFRKQLKEILQSYPDN